MHLYASATSPYARKVRIAILELGLSERVTIIPTAPTEDPDFRTVNPLGKIPALRLEDGTVIYDSLVILDWLDLAAGGGQLIPLVAEARNAELRRHALANGVIDAAFNLTLELRRPEEHRSELWNARWRAAIEAGAAALPAELPTDAITLATITTVSALDYVDFRLGDQGLDVGALRAWRDGLAPRTSFAQTLPQRELA